MEFRRLGASGLRVPALSFGTATFGGKANPAMLNERLKAKLNG